MGRKVLDRVNIMGIYICKGIWGIHWRWAWHLLAFQRTWRMIVYHYSERAWHREGDLEEAWLYIFLRYREG